MRCTATCLSLNTDLRGASGLPRRAVFWAHFRGLSLQLEQSRAGITETRNEHRKTPLCPLQARWNIAAPVRWPSREWGM
ncbi:hypothetical protein NDU88_007264 [Pleurodeles waltl]|uniref:Uncharacterized protein n=1 Tax=Pleurodeles waltl TaxID=8319 RepID=A0AAV7QNI4_PLEWA|nr:hypothetical protein NDU88_007264 [Pleurodeles waltl]